MISTKIASIIAVAAFVAGSFVASPELRAYAAATIGSADIIDESIQSVDIKNGQVKSVDIATSGVRASDIAKDVVTDYHIEGDERCIVNGFDFKIDAGNTFEHTCQTVFSGGLGDGSFVLATLNDPIDANCFTVMGAEGRDEDVIVHFKNLCDTAQPFDGAQVSLVVFR